MGATWQEKKKAEKEAALAAAEKAAAELAEHKLAAQRAAAAAKKVAGKLAADMGGSGSALVAEVWLPQPHAGAPSKVAATRGHACLLACMHARQEARRFRQHALSKAEETGEEEAGPDLSLIFPRG